MDFIAVEYVQNVVIEHLVQISKDTNWPHWVMAVSNPQVEKLKYLDAVIKECLRLYAPVFMITRECLQNITIDGQ